MYQETFVSLTSIVCIGLSPIKQIVYSKYVNKHIPVANGFFLIRANTTTAHCFNTDKEILQGFYVAWAAAKAGLEKVLVISWFDHDWKQNFASSSVFNHHMIAKAKQIVEDEKEGKTKAVGKVEKDKM